MQPAVNEHLNPKIYVDSATDKRSLNRNRQDDAFDNHNLTNIISITLNSEAVNDNQFITKAYKDRYHHENEQSRQKLSINFYDESNDLVKKNQDSNHKDKKLIKLDSVSVNSNRSSENELANKKYVDDLLGEGTIVRFNRTLDFYLEVSVGIDVYTLTKYD